jgi:hypothetical protein
MIDKLKKYDTVSFALEGVLDNELDGTENPLREEIQKLCRDLVYMGKRVIIYTKRYERSDNKHLSLENKKEYKPGYDLANKLGVSDIVFTNRNNFYHYMNNDNYQCHINCSGYETELIKRYKPAVNIININQEMWL